MNARELLAKGSPRPWRTGGFIYWGGPEEQADADDALLVRAVNEYEALLDIAEAARAFLDNVSGWNPNDGSWRYEDALEAALARLDALRTEGT